MASHVAITDTNQYLYEDLHALCTTSLQILSEYYEFQSCPAIINFILPKSEHFHHSNVLFEENETDFYIGMQFSNQIFTDVFTIKNSSSKNHIPINTASIIAEETSHLKFILDAVEHNKKFSLIDIEMFGEIDRFLCLMHWNFKHHTLKIPHRWQSLHDICDIMFSGRRFLNHNIEIYIEAEKRAFYHLKNAFQDIWDNTFCDFSKIDNTAKLYLKNLRQFF